ncbi:alpha/beta hydrolase [Roseibium sp. M-1]
MAMFGNVDNWSGLNAMEVIAHHDKEYDVESGVDDLLAYVGHWQEHSARARGELKCHLDVRFGPSKDEYLDIFPAAEPNAPVMIFFHGGWWRVGAGRDFDCIAAGFVPHGITTVIANYSLCPYVTIDEISRQARAAVAWTYNNIAKFNGDPERILVSGHSAGGQLTAQCMNTDWSLYGIPHDVIKAGVPVSGVFDLRELRYSFLQPYLQLDGAVIQRNSPQLQTPVKTDAPMLFIVGGDESASFHRQSLEYQELWKKSGNKADYVSVPGTNHFDVTWPLEDLHSEIVQQIVDLIR